MTDSKRIEAMGGSRDGAAPATARNLLVLSENARDATPFLTVSDGDAVVVELGDGEETTGLPDDMRWDTIVACPVREDAHGYRARVEDVLRDAAALLAPEGTVILDVDDAPVLGPLLRPLLPLATGLAGGRPVVRFGRVDETGSGGRGADGVDWATLGGLSVELAGSLRRELTTRQLLDAALAREDRLLTVVDEARDERRSRKPFTTIRRFARGLRRFAASGRWWLRQRGMVARRRRTG